MFFDLHTDLLYDLVQKRLQGKKNILQTDHLEALLKGGVKGGIWTYYTDIQHPLCRFDEAIQFILEELDLARHYIQIVRKREDFVDDKINILLGFESLAPVKDIKHLENLYALGWRHAMLTWNESNHFGTGVLGEPSRGLTELGKEAIHYMTDHHMIVDVSHANKKTFSDILTQTKASVLASHSNVYSLCPHPRNLTDEQLKELFKSDGFLGLTAVKHFVNPLKPTIGSFIDHLDYVEKLGGVQHVGFGFDFMNYLSGSSSNLADLQKAEDVPQLEVALQLKGWDSTVFMNHSLDWIKKKL